MRFDLSDDTEFFRATTSRFVDDEMSVCGKQCRKVHAVPVNKGIARE